MSDAGVEEDCDEDEALGPSLAYPPFYVLRSAAYCPTCGRAQHVYTLGCSAFHDAEDRRPVEEFHFLRRIKSMPKPLLALLEAKLPGYRFDQEEGEARPYLMNHCRCGAKLDDDFLHGDVGAAFWQDAPEGFRQFRLFRLPIAEAIPVESSYMLGGGEELDFDHAKPWTDL